MVQHPEVHDTKSAGTNTLPILLKVNVPREHVRHVGSVLVLVLLLIKLGEDGGSSRVFRCTSVFE